MNRLLRAQRYIIISLILSCPLFEPTSIGFAAPFADGTVHLLRKYCTDCHSGSEPEGKIDLEQMMVDQSVADRYREWQTGMRMLSEHRMPPEGEEQPSTAERVELTRGIHSALRHVATRLRGDPGHVVMRRLTDAEHNYTLRDLTGLDLELPDIAADAVGGEGFTNVGFVQFVQDATLERYLEAAKIVSRHAVIGAGPIQFFQDPGQTGLELSAINRILSIYRSHGFRTAAGEGGEPFGLQIYPKAFFTAWQFHHRERLGIPEITIEELATREQLSPRFAAHVLSVLSQASPTFPTSEIAAQWKRLPIPTDSDVPQSSVVRSECDAIYDALRKWQSRLAGANDEEVAPVLTEKALQVVAAEPFKVNVLWNEGEVTAKIEFAVRSIDAKDAHDPGSFAGVIWQNPRIRFRSLDGRRGPYQPLSEVLDQTNVDVLAFGKHPRDHDVSGDDFVIAVDESKSIAIRLPDGELSGELLVEPRFDDDGQPGRVVRAGVTAGKLGQRGKVISSLLADLSSVGYHEWRYGANEFAQVLPQVSQREPAPSDRDPIPAPFDNTYNMPERNDFHYKVKYFRDDQFLTDYILDADVRRQLDEAWADLLSSFEYHDVFLRFVVKKFGLETDDVDIATVTPDWIGQLETEPAQHVQRLVDEYQAAHELLDKARPGHFDETIRFAEQAWRRPLTEEDEQRLRSFYDAVQTEQGLDHVAAIRATLVRILVAPEFLYRAERSARDGGRSLLSDWEIANRLSYFLWSSLPDQELRRAASQGELHDPGRLVEQTRRMLRDPKSRRLATEFFGQWFGFYRFDRYRGVDAERFPEFTEELRESMYEEATTFFAHVIQEDRPIEEILSADFTFLNPSLAKHYGIDIRHTDSSLQRYDGVREDHRGGLFGLGAVLTVTSAPLRTSPVKRGDWVLRRVVGTPVPPPPADAGSIPADDVLADGSTIRDRLEVHRQRAACMNCHSRIDPLGFALEQFDAIGRWRETYRGGEAIEAGGTLSNGTEISGPDGLRRYLGDNEQLFQRTLCRKLLGYALGRRESLADTFLIEELLESADGELRFASLVEKIVTSDQFRYHRSGAD